MPPKTKNPSEVLRTFGQAKFDRYLYCPLPDDTEPEAIITWSGENGVTGVGVIDFLYRHAYRITIKQSGLDDTLVEVNAFDTCDTSAHAGCILSASAETIELALLCLLYKHVVVLRSDWGNATEERRSRRRFA